MVFFFVPMPVKSVLYNRISEGFLRVLQGEGGFSVTRVIRTIKNLFRLLSMSVSTTSKR